MTPILRNIAAALTILATVLTAGVVGAARGQAAAAGEIVICAGQGPVTIQLDADGNPTGPPHWCPDCVLSLFAAAAAETPLAEVAVTCTDCDASEHVAHVVAAPTPPPLARGPPSGA